MCTTYRDSCFTNLGGPNTIWAVSAIHGDLEKLTSIHDNILETIKPGDRLVYMGNYTGYGEDSASCIDEILTFRRLVLSLPGMMCEDIVYLRGGQEEMWQKLLQLQFAPDPTGTLLWMLGNGLSGTLASYSLSPHDGIEACRQGVMGLTKWTGSIREAIRSRPGHEIFGTKLLRAAYTLEKTDYPMLFVNAGVDAGKRLEDQGDNFWWAGEAFENIHDPYKPFEKVVRGYDPDHGGVNMNCVTATIDGGCGFGGNLVAAGFNNGGEVSELIEV